MAKEITSLQHPLVKHLIRLRKESEYRKTLKSAIIEGNKLVNEVCRHAHVKLILTSDPHIKFTFKPHEIFLVPQSIIDKISGVKSPENLIAEISLPEPGIFNKKMKFLLALDNLNDPGNLGTLFRTALALGWDAIYLIDSCCDPFNDKAIRAAKGATFILPIITGSWKHLEDIITKNDLYAFVADMDGTDISKKSKSIKNEKGICLVLGNEAHGASKEAYRVCETISIPIKKQMESLNVAVAGGILMYMLRNV